MTEPDSSSPDRQDVVTPEHMPSVVGLCPDPSHTGEFYVPHGGDCPADHFDHESVPMVEFVPLSRAPSAERGEVGYKAAMNRVAAERDALLGSGATGPLADALRGLERAEAEVERLREVLRFCVDLNDAIRNPDWRETVAQIRARARAALADREGGE